jgi:prepilin-type N-terminal cleavage/methylation domain-containing protein/prepilin-type processing-associated H-X9-DG protein
MKTRRAFTLIELLVVVAIIAILAAILFPVFGKTSQKGKATVSMNNLKQWGVALNGELADNDNRMPFDGMVSAGAAMDDTTSWFNSLPPYLKEKPLNHEDYRLKPPRPGDKSIWINPMVPKEVGEHYIKPPAKFLFCYAMNSYLSTSTDKMQKINLIDRPSATVFMAEKSDDEAAFEPKALRAYFGDGDPATDPQSSAHFLFCDGHVELRKRANFDPTILEDMPPDDPGPINTTILNSHFTYIPYLDAKPE